MMKFSSFIVGSFVEDADIDTKIVHQVRGREQGFDWLMMVGTLGCVTFCLLSWAVFLCFLRRSL